MPTSMLSSAPTARVALLHGAGYVGGELIRLLTAHPNVTLAAATSRTYAGQSYAAAHPSLRGQAEDSFLAPSDLDLASIDAVVLAAEHGQGMHVVPRLFADGFDGVIVDLSADFRFRDASVYPQWFDVEHAAPDWLDEAVYGLPELSASYPPDTRLVANPGCFATGIALALAPLAAQDAPLTAHITALTGASGSGATPSAATHFPDRDGNVRPYKVLAHQHTPEVQQVLGENFTLRFVPASGPWTRGIWGTIQITSPHGFGDLDAVGARFDDAYTEAPLVRCSPGTLPSLQPVARTPFCDLGWAMQGETLVVGFALDNLLKGAASQAVQNLNRLLGISEPAGLLPESTPAAAQA